MKENEAYLSLRPVVAEPLAIIDAATDADEQVVEMWLHGRSPHTVRAYRRDVRRFQGFTGKPLGAVTLRDLQAFADTLAGAPASRTRTLATLKSLLGFAARLGFVPFNVGAALRIVKHRKGLTDRILDEPAVQKMLLVTERVPRDHALIRLAYAGGLRVSEFVSVRWSDIARAPEGEAFVTVFGKGERTRTVRISAATFATLLALRNDASDDANDDAFVFGGRDGHLSPVQAWRIVRDAAKAANLKKPVSPHFLRHAHASHALDRGASIVLVRDTLGHASVATTNAYLHARPGESSSRYLAV